MEKRRFGRTKHESTIAIFGGAAFWDVTQQQADATMQLVVESGINHIDIAPSYGKAETLVGPWLKRMRESFFLGCKTTERTRELALSEAAQSLQRLQSDHFDLYQCHAVTSLQELDQITMRGGAVEALLELRRSGLTRYLGITSHGNHAPEILLQAMQRFDFDSVLFPFNFILCADETYRQSAQNLIQHCVENNIGMMVIKSIARGSWGNQPKTNTTWYQPFTTPEQIQTAVNFVLSYPVTGICTAGDVQLIPSIISACENFTPLAGETLSSMMSPVSETGEPLFRD